MINLNLKTILTECLQNKLELRQYREVMEMRKAGINDEFKKKFNGYYKVRQRNAAWYQVYYNLMEAGETDFEKVLRALYQVGGMVEVSFSSKLVSTLNPNLPIWDKIVLKNLKFYREWNKANNLPVEERIQCAVAIYEKMQKEYNEYLKSDDGKAFIAQFDATFEEFKDISDVKKLDLMLWAKG